MIKYIFFDLDGTMLPMNQDEFIKVYFTELSKRFSPVLGIEPETLIKSVWKATGAMIKNDGKEPNINVFWKVFAKLCGARVLEYLKDFDNFYTNEFNECKSVCKYNPNIPETIKVLKSKGYRLVAATNPLFPAVATNNRLTWAGVSKDDFELVTTYENASSCKPNPAYFKEIMDKLGAEPEQCMMIGNDVDEDILSSGSVGISSYLVTDCLINKEDKDISKFQSGTLRDLLTFARMMPDVK